MAVADATGADDQFRSEFLDRLGKVGGGAVDVEAIGLGPACNPAVAGNERGCAGRLNHRHERFGMTLKLGIRQSVGRHDDGRHVSAFQCVADKARPFVCILDIGCDQDEAAAVFELRHVLAHSFRHRVLVRPSRFRDVRGKSSAMASACHGVLDDLIYKLGLPRKGPHCVRRRLKAILQLLRS